MPDNSRTTARDIAALVGVSPGTVSKALSGKGAVHPDTRARILDAARELGFRGPSTHLPPENLNRTVGLLTRDPFDRRTAPVLLGVLETLTENDVAFLVCDGRGDPIREQYFVDSLRRRRVDGCLVAGSGPGSFSRQSIGDRLGVPVVYAMTESTDVSDVSILADNAGGVQLAVKHLLATGRRRIAAILGPAHEDAAKLKTTVAREVLAANGLDFITEPLCGQWDEEWGRQGAMQLVHAGVVFDGLICANDTIARGATQTLQELGISIPDDVGVVGFDNWRVMVEANRPRLTSVDLGLPDVGRLAAQSLIDAIDGRPHAAGSTIVPCRLVARDSTALPRASALRGARLFNPDHGE